MFYSDHMYVLYFTSWFNRHVIRTKLISNTATESLSTELWNTDQTGYKKCSSWLLSRHISKVACEKCW